MPDFPHLTFVPVEHLHVHELHDDQRTRPLIVRLRNSGVLRNPPIVAPLNDGTERCMVLDGANRVTALRAMGIPHVLVQVVQPDDPGLTLQTWNHVVWELNPERFINNIRAVEDVELLPIDHEAVQPDLEGDCGLMLVHDAAGRRYSVCTGRRGLPERVERMQAVVNSYAGRARLDRTSACDVTILREVYPQLSGLVVFPQFQVSDLLRLCGQGILLPSGITRFMIAPRALHVNYPLEELESQKTLDQKNADLHRWLQERIERKRVRYYAEPTFLFDE